MVNVGKYTIHGSYRLLQPSIETSMFLEANQKKNKWLKFMNLSNTWKNLENSPCDRSFPSALPTLPLKPAIQLPKKMVRIASNS